MAQGHSSDDRYSAVLAESDADLAANAMSIAVGVYSRVPLQHRLLAAAGLAVSVRTTPPPPQGQAIVGVVADVCAEAVQIDGPPGSPSWFVPLRSIDLVSGLPRGHREASALQRRRSAAALLRPLAGSQVTIALPDGPLTGVLERIGADHIELRQGLVPFTAIGWIRYGQSVDVQGHGV